MALYRPDFCIFQDGFGKVHDFPGGTVTGVQLGKFCLFIHGPQVIQSMAVVRVQYLSEVAQNGFGTRKKQIYHCVLDGSVVLHLINHQMSGDPALFQALKGSVQVEKGIYVCPFQCLFGRHDKQMGNAGVLAEVFI